MINDDLVDEIKTPGVDDIDFIRIGLLMIVTLC